MSPPLNKLAIAAGVIVDLAGSMVTILAVMFAAAFVAAAQAGVQGRVMPANIMEEWADDLAFPVTMMIVGVAWVVAGGFTAATLARRDHVRHGAWTGVFTFALGAFFALLPSPAGAGVPWWYNPMALAITIPAAIAGGYLAARRAARP